MSNALNRPTVARGEQPPGSRGRVDFRAVVKGLLSIPLIWIVVALLSLPIWVVLIGPFAVIPYEKARDRRGYR